MNGQSGDDVAVRTQRPDRVAGVALVCAALLFFSAMNVAFAQDATKSAPSPVAPGNLTKPVFDTTKPVYDPGSGLDKAASTMVAEVEGRPITLGEVGDAIKSLPPAMSQLPFETLYPGVLDQLVNQEALVIRAQNLGIDEDPVVRRRLRAAADHVLSDEYLRREGSKGITEAALLERYKRDIEGKPGAEEVHARIIMVPAENEAADLIAEIKGGADFATVARRASKDTTAPGGGDLGFVTREGLNPEMGAVIFASPEGQLVPYPVRSIGNWFVVKVEERRRRPTPGFASVREQLSHTLLQEAATHLAQGATEGMKVRHFDLLGQEVGDYARPGR